MAGCDFIVASSQLPVVSHSWFFFLHLSLPQNGQLQQRLDNVQRDFIVFNREK